MANSVLCGAPVTNPAVCGSDIPASFLGALSFGGDLFTASLGEADGRICEWAPWICWPSQAAAMNAVNNPTRSGPQTLIVQTCSVDQPSRAQQALTVVGKLEPTK